MRHVSLRSGRVREPVAEGRGAKGRPYPCVVELGLDADHVPFLLVLRAKNLQLRRLERPDSLRAIVISIVARVRMGVSRELTSRRQVHLGSQSQNSNTHVTRRWGNSQGSSDTIFVEVNLVKKSRVKIIEWCSTVF